MLQTLSLTTPLTQKILPWKYPTRTDREHFPLCMFFLSSHCGELTLAGLQVPTKPFYHSSSGQRRENYEERLKGWDKVRESNHRLLSWESTWEKINLIYYQSNHSRIIRNENKSQHTSASLLPSSQAQFHSQFSLTPLFSGCNAIVKWLFLLPEHFIWEELPASLLGSALARGRSILAGVGSVRRGRYLWHLLTEATPSSSPKLPKSGHTDPTTHIKFQCCDGLNYYSFCYTDAAIAIIAAVVLQVCRNWVWLLIYEVFDTATSAWSAYSVSSTGSSHRRVCKQHL